jgi:hypothetical protein
VAIYKRGDTYWYQFQFNGERIQQRETANLQWQDVYLQPAVHAELGHIAICGRKSRMRNGISA